MAQTVRVTARDVRELQRDLESIKLGLGRQVGLVLGESAGSVARAARPYTPVGPGPQSKKDNLPHIGGTIRAGSSAGAVARIVSPHPGAIVHEHGGDIAPRGVKISISKSAMAFRAFTQKRTAIAGRARRRIDRLIAGAGLRG